MKYIKLFEGFEKYTFKQIGDYYFKHFYQGDFNDYRIFVRNRLNDGVSSEQYYKSYTENDNYFIVFIDNKTLELFIYSSKEDKIIDEKNKSINDEHSLYIALNNNSFML